MGSAASRLGTSLLSSLAFSKFKSSKSFKEAAAAAVGGEGSSGAAEAEEAAAAEAAEAAAAAAEVEAARHMPGSSSAPVLDGSSSGAEGLLAEGPGAGGDGQPYTSLTFGALGSGDVAAPAGAPAPASPAGRSQLGGSTRSSATGAAGGAAWLQDCPGPSGLCHAGEEGGCCRLAGWAWQCAALVGWQGGHCSVLLWLACRLDFVLQVGQGRCRLASHVAAVQHSRTCRSCLFETTVGSVPGYCG